MTEALSVKIGLGSAGAVGGVAGAAAAATEKILNSILNTLKDIPIVTSMAKLFRALFILLLYPLVPLLKPVLEKLRDFIVFMQPHIKAIAKWTEDQTKSGNKSGKDIFKDLFASFDKGAFVSGIITFVVDALKSLLDLSMFALSGLWMALKDAVELIVIGVEGIWFSLKSAWNLIVIGLQGIWFGLKNTFMLIMQPFLDFGNFIKSLTDTLPAFFKGALNAAIRIINKLPGVKIPYLAEGGIVNRPTLAMIGERGPEAVVPLGRGGGFGGMNITINSPTFSNRNDMEMLIRELERRMQINMRRHTSYTP